MKVTQSCSIRCDPLDYRQSMEFSGQNTGVGSLSLLQGIFPIQGWNPCLLSSVSCTDRWFLFLFFYHILDLLQLPCRQEERTITSTLQFYGYILNRGRIQPRRQGKLFPSSRKQSCDWAAFFIDKWGSSSSHQFSDSFYTTCFCGTGEK